ncbi:MAG: hypothetical protein M1160_00460 [Candidatus Marsarchaeota archaeon]|jgi:hypothetical protein|nr:hypothetical protein [Candidatus Marsarchaeota archaeon]MCL5111342.1 hypothetical protein [Candidatus Marsarchaeota archaeon]
MPTVYADREYGPLPKTREPPTVYDIRDVHLPTGGPIGEDDFGDEVEGSGSRPCGCDDCLKDRELEFLLRNGMV